MIKKKANTVNPIIFIEIEESLFKIPKDRVTNIKTNKNISGV